ncbi:MAG: C40 family peptidase [Chitinophagaceae bacterium]|nr:C40 family peptidase [Chitinophagaceae bacterium]
MEYAVVNVPAAPVRRRPNHRKEMVNQLLFGEVVKVLKTKDPLWLKVRSLHDNYEGWLTRTLVAEVNEAFANTACSFVAAELLASITLEGKVLHIPVGSSLPMLENTKGTLGEMGYEFSGKTVNRHELKHDLIQLKELAEPWLNAPYLWGGRTPLGVDCSGYTQVIFKQMGIDLPRDAWQQAQEGKVVRKYKEAQPGDLVFFNNKEDIVHTGILLGNDQIIHASGKVRVDMIDKKGITDAATGKRTLSLKAIRRLW